MTFTQKLSIIIYAIVIAQGAVTIVYLLLKAKKTDVLYGLCLAEFFVVPWLIFGMYENMVSITLFPISMIGGLWLIFALLYAKIITFKNKLVIFLIMSPLVITYLPSLTTNYFHLVVVSKTIDNPAITVWGPVFRINLYITYVYIVTSFAIALYKVARETYHSKKKFFVVAMAILIPLLVSVLTANNIIKLPVFDITPASFSILFLLFPIAVMKFRFLDVIPFATNDIFQNMKKQFLLPTPTT